MGALEYIGDPTEEQIAQWENEGGNAMKETKSEQKASLHSLRIVFLQERFLKALFAQTIYDKVVWRQIDSFFQALHGIYPGVYTEIWETMVSNVSIALKYQEPAYVVGRFFTKGLSMGESIVDIIISPNKAPHFSLSPNDKEALYFQLYSEIKEQKDRMTRKWHKENMSDDLPSNVAGIADVLLFLVDKLGMSEINE